MISEDDVAKVAHLARLALSKEECKTPDGQLASILAILRRCRKV